MWFFFSFGSNKVFIIIINVAEWYIEKSMTNRIIIATRIQCQNKNDGDDKIQKGISVNIKNTVEAETRNNTGGIEYGISNWSMHFFVILL